MLQEGERDNVMGVMNGEGTRLPPQCCTRQEDGTTTDAVTRPRCHSHPLTENKDKRLLHCKTALLDNNAGQDA